MPSQVVDEAWHNFILFTKEYKKFCNGTFGRFLHHIPAEAMTSRTYAQTGIKSTWRVCCQNEEINTKFPKRLPLLFSIDSLLKIEDGFKYSLNCSRSKDNSFCASDIGCAGGGDNYYLYNIGDMGCNSDNGCCGD